MAEEINVTNEQFREVVSERNEAQIPPKILNRTRQYRWDSDRDPRTNNGQLVLDVDSSGGFAFITQGEDVTRRFNGGGAQDWATPGDFGSPDTHGLGFNSDYVVLNHSNEIQVIEPNKFTRRQYIDTDNRNVNRCVYLTDNNEIYAADTDFAIYNFDGERIFRENIPFRAYDIAVDEDTGDTYFATNNNSVAKYDSDGNEVWEVTSYIGSNVRAIAYDEAENSLYIGTDEPNVYRVDPSDGTKIWEAYSNTGNAPGSFRAIDTNAEGDIFAGATDGTLLYLQDVDGSFDSLDLKPNDNNDIRTLVTDTSNATSVYVGFNDSEEQLQLVDMGTLNIEATYNAANDREIRDLGVVTLSDSTRRVFTVTDNQHHKLHDASSLTPNGGPDLFGNDEHRDVIYVPSEDNYYISRRRAGIEIRDAITGNLERVFHENGDRQEQISRNVDYGNFHNIISGEIYVDDFNNSYLKVYDVSTSSIVRIGKWPFENNPEMFVKEDPNGNARILTRPDPHIVALDGQFNQIYRKLVPRPNNDNGLNQIYTDGTHDFITQDRETIQKLDPDTGAVLEVEAYQRYGNSINKDFKDYLILRGSDSHLINKSDLSYYGPVPARPNYDDVSNIYPDEANDRLLAYFSTNRTLFIQQFDFNTAEENTRTLHRGQIHGDRFYINSERSQGQLEDSRGDRLENQRKFDAKVYFANGTVFVTGDGDNNSVGTVDGVQISTQDR